tara:strand:+ start:429 stop:1115 length:687 start_codon:yes stop_codon:yes gene_type:complete
MTDEMRQELRDSSIQEKLHYVQTHLGVKKSAFNQFGKYNYRTLPMILEYLKPHLVLTNCTFTLSDDIVAIGERNYVKATATFGDHNGDVIEATAFAREAPAHKGMDDAQLTGTTSSYARKYACNGLFAIDDTADNDVHGSLHPDTDKDIPNVEELQGNTKGPVKKADPNIIELRRLAKLAIWKKLEETKDLDMVKTVEQFLKKKPSAEELQKKVDGLTKTVKLAEGGK